MVAGVVAVVGIGAGCDYRCNGERGDASFRDDTSRPYRYGFDVSRAPFHDDDAEEAGAMSVDRAANQVVVRYVTSAGEKVETWAIDVLERRSTP